MKIADYMDIWFEANKKLLAPTTARAYNIYIDHHFKPYFGNKKVCQISQLQIKEYMSLKLEKLSSTTVRKHFFTLSRILRDALKEKSPCIGIRSPENTEFKPVIPTEKEFDMIWDIFRAISLEDEVIILLAGWCGLRRGEIFALKWDDINEEDGIIRIDEAVALEEKGYGFELKEPKSHNGNREIAVPDYLMSLLKKLKQEKPVNKKGPDIDPQVCKQNPHSFTKKYIKIRDRNKLPKVRFHDLRHYHASLLYKNKVPDLYAAERLGHDVMVLKKIYQHLGLEEHKKIDQQVKDMFKK
jgi:integrase